MSIRCVCVGFSSLLVAACGDDDGASPAQDSSGGAVGSSTGAVGDTAATTVTPGPTETGNGTDGGTAADSTGETTALAGSSDTGEPSEDSSGSDSSSGGAAVECMDLGGDKGEVAAAAISSGITVTLSNGDTRGELVVPFTQPAPDVDPTTLAFELIAAVDLLVENEASLYSVDFGAASLAMAMLANPGEYTWELDEARCEVTLRFVNETPAGATLVAGSQYAATFSIGPNDYFETLPVTAFPVTVVSR